ncbi:hypothetical protein N9K67_09330 [Opitutaceae bacterium]|nr:hypothetical protein [Opitutaceae bacterium]
MAEPDLTPPPETSSAAKPDSSDGKPVKNTEGNGSGWILALAIMQVIGAVFIYKLDGSAAGPIAFFASTIGLAIIFFGLWLWGRKAPFPALLTALIVFVSFHLLDAVIDPTTLLQGIVVKIAMIIGLGTATKKAYLKKREHELENELS